MGIKSVIRTLRYSQSHNYEASYIRYTRMNIEIKVYQEKSADILFGKNPF